MAQHNVSVEDTLKVLVENKKYSTVKDVLVTMNPSDIASIFDELPEDQLPIMFRLLPKALAADTFVEMEPDNQEILIRGFSDTELKQVLDELYIDDAADIVEEMPANVVSRILRHVTPDRRREINEILQFPENSAGSIMTTEYVSLSADMTVSDAFQKIRDTDSQNPRHLRKEGNVRQRKSSLPLGDRLVRHPQLIRKLLLCQLSLFPERPDTGAKPRLFHS